MLNFSLITRRTLAVFYSALLIVALGSTPALAHTDPGKGAQTVSKGLASWYGKRFHGRKTASGERFDMNALTAAHRTLPLGSKVRVTNVTNGKSVVVKINDRGPFHDKKRRIIDLSYGAATKLGIVDKGTAPVRVEKL